MLVDLVVGEGVVVVDVVVVVDEVIEMVVGSLVLEVLFSGALVAADVVGIAVVELVVGMVVGALVLKVLFSGALVAADVVLEDAVVRSEFLGSFKIASLTLEF